MKKYKKLLMVAPLACMLGTGVFVLPNAAHAEQPSSYWIRDLEAKRTFSKENLANDLAYSGLRMGIERFPEIRQKFKIADDERIQAENPSTSTNSPEIFYDLQGQLSNMQYALRGTSYNVNAQVDSFTDVGQTNLITYNNDDGTVQQEILSPEKTETVTETMTYTNQYGMKLGVEFATKFSAGIEKIVSGEQSFKVNTEFSYNRTDTNTTSKTNTVTFKAQKVLAAPGGTTTFYGTIKKANFSGSFQTDAYLSGVTLKLPIVKKNGNMRDVVHTETATLTAEDLYKIYKNRAYLGMPSYLSFDDANKRVVVNKLNLAFNGEGGYQTNVLVKFTPKDKNKPTRTMTYNQYVSSAQKGAL
ncbi:ETX/MTX2 family pore-forming toxin [Bacillus sp. SH8-8]|uniref:ETX/MTX2 family pore-forming toxin n=1 Tax=Bacillus sp. SH8-8 TaxID=2217830 RepID=UPI0034D424A5